VHDAVRPLQSASPSLEALPASDRNLARAAERPACLGATILPKDPRVRRRRPRRASEQAQVRADSERAIVKYQQPPARFSAPRTRKKAAHP
jgi:hypothetical protein